MLLSLDTKGLEGLARDIGVVRDQIPFALSLGLHKAAEAIIKAEQQEMLSVFKHTSRYVLNSLFIERSTKTNLNLRIAPKKPSGSKDRDVNNILASEVDGGPRQTKRFELALTALGHLPDGHRVVPPKGMSTLTRTVINGVLKVLRTVKAQGSSLGSGAYVKSFKLGGTLRGKAYTNTQKATGTGLSDTMFVLSRQWGRLPPGLYVRYMAANGAHTIKPICIFVSAAYYRAIFKFHDVGARIFNVEFERQFAIEVEKALKAGRFEAKK